MNEAVEEELREEYWLLADEADQPQFLLETDELAYLLVFSSVERTQVLLERTTELTRCAPLQVTKEEILDLFEGDYGGVLILDLEDPDEAFIISNVGDLFDDYSDIPDTLEDL